MNAVLSTKRFIRLLLVLWSASIASRGHGAAATCPSECLCRTIFDIEIGSTERIECKRGDMYNIPTQAFDPDVDKVIISAPPSRPNHLNIGPVFTQPSPFVSLRELHIINSNVPSIGKHSFWGLVKLKLLKLTGNNLTSINAENFRGLISLVELHLDHNNIDQMSSETFRYVPALKTLNLAHNNISVLVPRLFRMLANLTVLNLNDNPITELNPEVFKDIQNLRILKCRRCLLNRGNTQIYYLVPNLEELDLGENLFKYLTTDEFISLKKLKDLKLDGNQLSAIVDNTFGNNRELRSLSMARNRLAVLAPASLTNLTTLFDLDISYNKIERFHLQTFAPVVNSLKTIRFSGNNLPLYEIAIVLQILPEIHGVGLANLSLTEIPSNFFMYNKHLIELDLSWNQISIFPFKLLTKTKYLQKINLSRNKIRTLQEDDLQRLEAIADVNLSKNNWLCDQCSAGNMILFMETTVLNSTIRQLKCHSPLRLHGVSFGELTFEDLEQCGSAYEAQLSLIAGLLLLCVAVLATVTIALCCSRRRAMNYYTNNDKRREKRSERGRDQSEDRISQTELVSISTVSAPYHLVTKSS